MTIDDDLANGKHPYSVIACMPVHGRLPLLKVTIERLFKVNGCSQVICSGDGLEEKKLCDSLGAIWVPHANKPLGAKWNSAFERARDFDPDAVLYVGSSDWVSDDWIWRMMPHVQKNHFVGMAGCYFLDVGAEKRLVYWGGYKTTQFHSDRSDETIGIGRMISKSLMDSLDWKPFYDHYDNSLDRSMKERCKKCGFDDFMVDGPQKALSISTNKWVNKHNFMHHWAGSIVSERIDNVDQWLTINFPQTW